MKHKYLKIFGVVFVLLICTAVSGCFLPRSKTEQSELSVVAVYPKYGDDKVQLTYSGGSGSGQVKFYLDSGTDGTALTESGLLTVGEPGYIEVYAEKAGDNDYYPQQSEYLMIEIRKGDPHILEKPAGYTGHYGPAFEELPLLGGRANVGGTFSWDAEMSEKPKVADAQQQVIFTPDDTDNYNEVRFFIDMSVQKAVAPAIEFPTAEPATLYQHLYSVFLVGGESEYGEFRWKDNNIILSELGINDFLLVFEPSDTDNYDWSDTVLEKNVSITVTKIPQTIEEKDIRWESAIVDVTDTAVEMKNYNNDNLTGIVYEYKIDNGEWDYIGMEYHGAKVRYENLLPDTEYTLYIRKRETDDHEASNALARKVRTELYYILDYKSGIIMGLTDAGKEKTDLTISTEFNGKKFLNVGNNAFSGNTVLESVTIPKEITRLGNYAFAGCTALETVTFESGSGIYMLGTHIFQNCTSLKTFAVPSEFKELAGNMFEGCIELTAVSFENDSACTKIGASAFSGCKSLAGIDLPQSVNSVGRDAFSKCISLTDIIYTASMTTLSSGMFEGCTGLTAITIPAGISLSIFTFKDCTNLISVSFDPNTTIEALMTSVFEGCSKLTAFTIPKTVKVIESYAFNKCIALESFTIPSDSELVSIGIVSFGSCRKLTSLVLPESLVWIAQQAFDGCTMLADITGGEKVKIVGKEAFKNTKWYADKPNNSLVIFGRVLCGVKGTISNVVIPEGIIAIADYALGSTVNSISLPVTLEYIGQGSLMIRTTGLFIPRNVSYISTSAFEDGIYFNSSLIAAFVVDDDNQAFSSKDGVIYSKDFSALLFYPPAKTDASYTVDSRTVTIGAYAFSNNKLLTALILPDTMERIDNYAFNKCTSITELFVPLSVAYLGTSVFSGWGSGQKISFATGAPGAWSTSWQNSCSADIVWSALS